MVNIPESTNASVDAIRGYFNAYLMHKMFVDYLVNNLGAGELMEREWMERKTAGSVNRNLKHLLRVLKHNVKNLAQLVSSF